MHEHRPQSTVRPAASGRAHFARRFLTAGLAPLVLWLSSATAAARDVEVTRIDGTVLRGELRAAFPALSVATEGGEQFLNWGDVLHLRTSGQAAPPATTQSAGLRITLADGSSFRAGIDTATERDFVVRFRGEQTARLSLSAVRSIVAEPVAAAARAHVESLRSADGSTQDVVVVARNDRTVVLRGAIRGISPQNVLIDWNEREVAVPWDRIAAVRVAAAELRESPLTVRTLDGDVFAGRVIDGDTGSLTIQSAAFDRLQLPWPEIDAIDCRSARLEFLSNLQPLSYEFTPLIEKRWPLAVNRTFSGGPIRLGGREYSHGLTMHSRSVVTYSLRGGYSQFAAVVGILDEMGERGDVTARVIGDSRLLWERVSIRGGQPPIEISVDVSGVQQLSLEVDFSGELDLSDQFAWAMARVIR